MQSKKDAATITVPLTEEQEKHLREIRNEFDLYRISKQLDDIFSYALEGFGNSCHAGDVTQDFYALSRVRQLVAILMQPGIEM